jgi:predicted TIM-barrel fold metal-dependent hydrolase
MSRITLDNNYLDHAEKQAIKKGLYDFPIVDVDCHYMMTPLHEISEYIDEPWRSRLKVRNQYTHIPFDVGDRTVGSRLKSYENFYKKMNNHDKNAPKEIFPLLESSQKLAIDYNVIFPTDLLSLGVHPDSDLEVAIAFGFGRWMTEKVLPYDDSLKTMLYLPLSNPKACVKLIEELGDKKGVVGALVTSHRNQPIHHNDFMPVFKLLEEKGLPLGFHTVSFWMDQPLKQLNRFFSAHALGFPLYNMIHMTNLIVNGIPERFPDLKIMFIEAGVAWIPFMMMRLDSEYMYRSSEAPLLTKKPSEYVKNFYYTTQPLENTADPEFMKQLFNMVDAENQFLYASDYPHQDFDTPSSIYDIPFLSEEAKRKILGGNALKLFGIDNPILHAKNRSSFL